jgi:hypothetical protein
LTFGCEFGKADAYCASMTNSTLVEAAAQTDVFRAEPLFASSDYREGLAAAIGAFP